MCTHPRPGIPGAPAGVQPGRGTAQTAERDPRLDLTGAAQRDGCSPQETRRQGLCGGWLGCVGQSDHQAGGSPQGFTQSVSEGQEAIINTSWCGLVPTGQRKGQRKRENKGHVGGDRSKSLPV